MMDLGLEGRRALIGGGGSGLGGGIATVLAAEGARVALIGRTRERVEREAAKLGGTPVVADLATPDGAATAGPAAVGQPGGLDPLVGHNGGPPRGPLRPPPPAGWGTPVARGPQAPPRPV